MTDFNLKNPVHLLASGFGSGLSKKAPGTVGTLAALPFYALFVYFSDTGYLLMLGVTFLLGIYLCGKTANDLGVHDHGGIVWDEFVGMWLVLYFLPSPHWLWIAIAFVYFRLFDIVKPFPIGWLDRRLKGGFGIMLDDVLAALYAIIALKITLLAYLYNVCGSFTCAG